MCGALGIEFLGSLPDRFLGRLFPLKFLRAKQRHLELEASAKAIALQTLTATLFVCECFGYRDPPKDRLPTMRQPVMLL